MHEGLGDAVSMFTTSWHCSTNAPQGLASHTGAAANTVSEPARGRREAVGGPESSTHDGQREVSKAPVLAS